ANFCRYMEERFSGAVFSRAIPSDVSELHGLDPLRATYGAPTQPAGRDHQRLRLRDRDHLRHPFLDVLRAQQEAQGFHVAHGGTHFHYGSLPHHVNPASQPQQTLSACRIHMHCLQHFDVCFPLGRYETGGQDQKR
ncbi:hypothetical protein S245_044653, partial [Arachis hypogaea]